MCQQASRVATLCKTIEDRFEKFEKLLTLQFRSLTAKVDDLLLSPVPDHSDKLVMLSAKFDQLNSKINSITPVTDPTEGIIRGVEALLNKGGGDTPLRPGSSSKTRFDTGA